MASPKPHALNVEWVMHVFRVPSEPWGDPPVESRSVPARQGSHVCAGKGLSTLSALVPSRETQGL